MGRKPGVQNKPKPIGGISKSDIIMAIVNTLSDDDIEAALFMRRLNRLNIRGRIEVCRFMIQLYEDPLKYVRSGVTLADCKNTIERLQQQIATYEKELAGQEAESNDEVHD